jgi:protein LSM14
LSNGLRKLLTQARYVGTLIEINSEQSTVSLDNVRSFGTEGRRGGKDEYQPSDAVYEQIVFRGSDVKDLRIEEQPKEKPPMPQDPAIIGVRHLSPSHSFITLSND